MDFDRRDQKEPGFGNLSFDSPTAMLGEAVRRFAGQPFPEEIQRVKDALFGGVINLEDDSARVSISPFGQFELKPKNSNFNLGIDPMQQSIRIGYDSNQTKPQPDALDLMAEEPTRPSAGRQYADQLIRQYQEQNPDWYRR